MTLNSSGFELTFGPAEEIYGTQGELDISRVPGATDEDLDELRAMLPGVRVARRPGSIGKGASGPGATLIFEFGERILNDGASMLAYGAALMSVVTWLKSHRQKHVNVDDPAAAGVLAAAQSRASEELVGAYHTGTVCISGGGPGLGVDVRDIWVTTFALPDQWYLVIFTSPSALVLGEVKVPSEVDGKGKRRTGGEVRDLFLDQGIRDAS